MIVAQKSRHRRFARIVVVAIMRLLLTHRYGYSWQHLFSGCHAGSHLLGKGGRGGAIPHRHRIVGGGEGRGEQHHVVAIVPDNGVVVLLKPWEEEEDTEVEQPHIGVSDDGVVVPLKPWEEEENEKEEGEQPYVLWRYISYHAVVLLQPWEEEREKGEGSNITSA